jgi:hypothetical protein
VSWDHPEDAEVVDVAFDLPCTIRRSHHKVPLVPGTFMVCSYRNSTIRLHQDLNRNVFVSNPISDAELLMKDAGVGSIIGHQYYVCPLELHRATIKSPSYDHGMQARTPALVQDVYQNMWYLVSFLKGLYWVRYDWVTVIRTADQV